MEEKNEKVGWIILELLWVTFRSKRKILRNLNIARIIEATEENYAPKDIDRSRITKPNDNRIMISSNSSQRSRKYCCKRSSKQIKQQKTNKIAFKNNDAILCTLTPVPYAFRQISIWKMIRMNNSTYRRVLSMLFSSS